MLKTERGELAYLEAEKDRMAAGKKTGAVVLAGGQGKRMHSQVQKQYLILAGRPLICHALEAFEHSCVDQIVLVVGAGEEEYVRREILAPMCLQKVSAVVAGGKERYHSVYQGLKALEDCDYVLIHDGARPMITSQMINRIVEETVKWKACVAGMPVKDTIKIADEKAYAVTTPDRSRLWQIQTPQAFAYDLVRGAYDHLMQDEAIQKGITDDAMVIETFTEQRVKLIEGSYENLKVTTPEDLILAEALLKHREAENQ